MIKEFCQKEIICREFLGGREWVSENTVKGPCFDGSFHP
jgi:hypothetical protein